VAVAEEEAVVGAEEAVAAQPLVVERAAERSDQRTTRP
jgi:hypothetical protein